MDYEKKYEKLVDAVKVLRDNNPSDEGIQNWVNDNVPELAESDDEKIRKELIFYFQQEIPQCSIQEHADKMKEFIVWLEKQGESKFESCIQEGDKLVTNEDGTHFNISQLERVAKKEPRFEDGDWIVQKGLGTYKIVEICESWYEVISYKYGIQYSIGFDKENDCHLWTIQDAKDGDVLQLGGVTSIFKEFIGNNNCKCYCSVCNGEFEIPSKDGADNSYGCCNATPATKEQRELLFQKIKEAGCEWDAEKKEVKKIEQNPAWSEDDEQMLNHIICDIESLKEEVVYCKTVCNEEIAWLKSLKDRMKGE